MAEKTSNPSFPIGEIFRSSAVRGHLQRAGLELLLAARAGLTTMTAHVVATGLDRPYPYLRSALKNLVAAVERLAAGGKGKTRDAGHKRRGG
ncbi:MAG: hypothetical protein HYV03_07045 [Deltaproteobacteria bacterium]|nr:hypothetical protein [Deltaproteobacteria bacterium]